MKMANAACLATAALLLCGTPAFAGDKIKLKNPTRVSKEKGDSKSESKDSEEGFVSLFNGKDLTGWKASDIQRSKIHAEDGKVVVGGPTSHLFTDEDFKNFILRLDVMSTPGSNSGIYFHTKYANGFPPTGHEVQVNVSHKDPIRSGSIYHFVKLYETPAKDNEWCPYEITVKGRNVVVKINGKVVTDYTEPEGAKGPEVFSHGSIALQAHDPLSTTYYRNIRVKRLPD